MDTPPRSVQIALTVVLGALSALLGIGGGTLMVPLLTLFAFPIHRAVSTASVFGFVISVPATLVYIANGWQVSDLPPLSTGYVNWAAFAILVPMTMWFAPLGVRLAYKPAQHQRRYCVDFGPGLRQYRRVLA